MLTHTGTQTIETERLILRRFEYSDCGSVFANWASDEEVQKMYSEPVYSTPEAVKGLLDKYISAYEKEDCYRWAVIERKSGQCIGQIAYFLVDSKNHFAEIEYCIGQQFQCRGFATEAAKAVIDFGFRKMNLHKVQICTKTINAPSKRVIEKESGECIGQIAYFLVDSKNHFAEIEYCIGSEYQCKGYATEAAKAVIKYGFDEMNLHKVQICTKTINAPSKRVIEKCGLQYEGTLRDYFYMNGVYVGRLYFSILRDEYENREVKYD